ncbi:MAG: hypothetical protein R2710_22995 [Acidimicrobiales bacterium]
MNELRSTIGVEVGDDLEILVVDDGSPDDTAEQLERPAPPWSSSTPIRARAQLCEPG